MKKSLFLTCFVMLCSLVFGQHWTVNDALYENNMSLLANAKIGNEIVANAEIAAFYDDEVRGVGRTDANGEVLLQINGRNREQISFKLYDGAKEYASNYTVDFVTDAINEDPVTIEFYEVHWNYVPNYDLRESMTIVGKIHIDGVPQNGDNFELAVFYNDSLRSVARPNNGIVYLYIPGNGHEDKPFEFKLYDGTIELVSDLRDLYVEFEINSYDGTLDAPQPLNFITAPYVAQIGEVRYQSLASAFEAAQAGDVITMIDNVTEVVNITKTEAVTLDLASFTLTGSILAPNAKLTVENGNIINNDKTVSAIEINAGELALNNVNISSERHAVRIDGAVTATIDGGTYKVLGLNKGTYHTVNVSGAANVTILNGTFDGPKGTSADSGSAVNVQSGAEVIIEGGEFSGGKNNLLSSKGTLTLTGGTYDQDVQKYCAYGYMSLKGNDGKYTVVEAAARIGEKYYKTFDAAYKAAKDGDVVELFRTAVIDGMIVNYNTKNITVKAEFGDVAFRVQNARLATFSGMTIKSNDYCIIVGAADGSTSPCVDITGGTYEGVTSAISVTKGDVQILDGTFKVEPYNGSYEYTINCIDANYNATPRLADVSIKGGKFYNFNPQNNAAEGAGTDFLTGDYTAVQDAEGWYSVGKGVARVVTAGKDKSYATLLDAIKAVKEGEHIELLSNITLDYNARDSYETQTQNIVIDGKGYVLTLNQKNSDWASVGLANGSKLVLSNMTIEKTGYGDTSGAWNTHAIIFSCPLEMNDVTVNNGIAVQAGATLNDVTINEANGYYGLWINGNGQEVTVNGGAINATNGGRGIKIADQYIDAPAQVTLNVDGTVFNTAKKAAVLVTSTAGAEITATNVDITNVASDNTNFAWVDEARANYFGNVTLNNGNAYVEGGEESYEVSAKTDGVFGYYKKLETALAANNTSDITILRPITIANGETRVLDLNGKTVTGTDNGTASYGLFTNKGNLTINDTKVNGKITLTAKNNRGWNAYSSVISNQVGGKLTVNGGTIEHLGGTDMAYGIDNLTNGKGTYAETVVNGGTVKSTYRAIRQFLNGIEAQNILTVNGGTIESTGGNKSIWMQDPSANANSGTLTVGAGASLIGDAYLDVTAGSTEWPVQVSIAKAALKNGSTVVSENVPAKYQVKLVDGYYTVVEIAPAAKIGETIYYSLAAAINAATNGQTITLLRDVNENVTITKDLTIDGADKNYTGNIAVNGSQVDVIVKNVKFINGTGYAITTNSIKSITVENCTVNSYGYGFLYANKSTPTVVVKNVTVNGGNYGMHWVYGTKATLENVTMTNVTNGLYIQNYASKTINVKNSTISSIAIWERDGYSAVQTFKFEGTNTVGSLENSQCAKYVITDKDATITAPEGATVTTTVADYTVKYLGGAYKLVPNVVELVKTNGEKEIFGSIQEAINAAQDGNEIVLLKNIELSDEDIVPTPTVAPMKTMVYVKDKDITLNMNEKSISVKYVGDPYLISVICVEDAAGLKVIGNGRIDVEGVAYGDKFNVAYVFCKRGSTGHLTIENGTYHADDLEDSMVYTNGNAIVNINGGTFKLDNVGTQTNGFPCIFNVAGGNAGHVVVNGGTFNSDVNHQFWANEVYVPETKALQNNGDVTWTVVPAVAYVKEIATSTGSRTRNVGYATLAEAVAAVRNNETITLVWEEDKAPIAMNASLFGKNATITGTATVDWSKGFLFVGRGGEGNATLTFDNANLTSASNSSSYGIHVSGREKNTNNKYDGTVVIKNSTIELDYLINRGTMTLDNGAVLTVKNGFGIAGRPASETESNENATATITLNDASRLVVINHNGMGLGQAATTLEGYGIMNINSGATFETKQAFKVSANGTMNNAGTVNVAGALTNNGTINFTDDAATLATTTEGLVIGYNLNPKNEVVYSEGVYRVAKKTTGTLTRKLINGWSWFSSYIDIEGSDGLGLLTEALGSSAEQIKEGTSGLGKFVQYSSASNIWYGNLEATSSKKMYQIKTKEDVEISIHGDLFVEDYRPMLRKGWNYLSYPHADILETALALQGFSPVNGDIIKTLDQTFTYRNGSWMGQLTKLNPGEGYMYKTAGEDREVSYTTEATRSTAKVLVSESPEHWTVGAAQYPNNMTMIATLDVEGGDYEVAAFVNGELRGSVRPIYVEDLDQYIMVMTILGEEVADVTFKYYDFNTEEEYDLNNVVVYSDNAVLGSVEEPYTLTRGTTGIGEATLSDINIYPNPTTTDREINLQATCDKVEVFNTLGVKVAEYQNVDTIDALETAGTYVIRVTLNGNVKHCRLVVK